MPAGVQRDFAIFGAIKSLAYRDPKKAMDLVIRISEPERREKEVISHGRDWMMTKPEAAETAIRANPAISEVEKSEIFKESAP